MAGHSKWHTIKHTKGALDAERSKLFTKLIRQMTIAARIGGGDPDAKGFVGHVWITAGPERRNEP